MWSSKRTYRVADSWVPLRCNNAPWEEALLDDGALVRAVGCEAGSGNKLCVDWTTGPLEIELESSNWECPW